MSAKRGPTPPRQWVTMRHAVAVRKHESTAALREKFGVVDEPRDVEMWMNDRYVVIVSRHSDGWVESLSIRRTDRGWPRDWRDFQRIKNDICGVDVEAVELYPSEARLMDTANQFWLWCLPPGVGFPFGFDDGRIVSGAELAESIGAAQRELEEDAHG